MESITEKEEVLEYFNAERQRWKEVVETRPQRVVERLNKLKEGSQGGTVFRSQRRELAQRNFVSEAVEEVLQDIRGRMKVCFSNNLKWSLAYTKIDTHTITLTLMSL